MTNLTVDQARARARIDRLRHRWYETEQTCGCGRRVKFYRPGDWYHLGVGLGPDDMCPKPPELPLFSDDA